MKRKNTSIPKPEQLEDTDVTTWKLPEGATARLGRGQIGKIAFSPDGTHLVVGTRIGCWWYNLNTMTHYALWGTERGMVSTISFSPDAQWIAVGDWDGIVKIWDSQNLQCVRKIDVPGNSMSSMAIAGNLTFSQDGQYLTFSNAIAYGGFHCAAHAWQTNISTPMTSFTVKPKPKRRYLSSPKAFSPGGHLLAYTSDANITSILDVKTGEYIAELPDEYEEGCYKLVFSHCGRYLAACNSGNSVHVWNIHNGTYEMPPTPYGEDSYIKYGIPSDTSDGTLRVAGIGGIEVVIWDATQQKTVDVFESWNPDQGSACFSNDGTQFAVANGRGELKVWTEGTAALASLPVHHQNVSPISFSNDSHRLVSNHKTRSAICVWNVKRRQVERTFHFQTRNPNGPSSIVLSNSLELLATTEESENSIEVWNLLSKTQVTEFAENPARVRNMVFSPTEEYLVTAGLRTPTKIWHVASGTQVTELPKSPSSHVSKIGFSPTGAYFVIIYGDSIAVWDVQQWEKHYHAPLTPQTYPGWKLHFDLNGKQFFTRPPRGAAIVWNFKSDEQIGLLDIEPCVKTSIYKGMHQDLQRAQERQKEGPRRIRALQTSTHHNIIAGGMWGEIRLWDATTFKVRMALIQPTGCQAPFALAFSPCGNYLASGSRWDPQWEKGQQKTSVRLWDITTGENIHTFWGHPTDVLSLKFSPDGTLLASSSYDGTILLWDMKPFINS